MGEVIDLTDQFLKRQYTPLRGMAWKHLPGKHDQRSHTPKKYGKGGGKALRVGDKPGDYVDKAMLALSYGDAGPSDVPYDHEGGLLSHRPGDYVKTMNQVAEDVAGRTDLVKTEVQAVLETWNGRVADQMDSMYYGLKRGLAEEFGLEETLPEWFLDNEAKVVGSEKWSNPRWPLETRKAYYEQARQHGKVAARVMYEDTQKRLADAGIKDVTVYRGHVSRASRKLKVGDATGVNSTSASSWSLDPSVARRFADDDYSLGQDNAGVVLQATVPASRVLSYHRTGFGTNSEFEIVVLEDPIAEDQAKVTERYTQ
jgi:hypothetical protein